MGYVIVAVSLFVLVQAQSVFPQLLLARIFFSIGGAATATMVTAVLPAVAIRKEGDPPTEVGAGGTPALGQRVSSPASSEATLTPARVANKANRGATSRWFSYLSGSRLAGVVGAFAGFGALVALGCFLPLPSYFQRRGISPSGSLKDAYYMVGSVAFVVAICCFAGLSNLPGEQSKSISAVWNSKISIGVAGNENQSQSPPQLQLPYWKLFMQSVQVAGLYPDIGLAYVGGFVARASSVGLSLFIPLFVNHYFTSSGLCDLDDDSLVKSQCKEAYVLAAKLTGFSQLIALLTAPLFGLFSERFGTNQVPLLFAGMSGILGYSGFAFVVQTPDPTREGGSYWIYVLVCLLGVGQIGAIVCSLGLLSSAISNPQNSPHRRSSDHTGQFEDRTSISPEVSHGNDFGRTDETNALLGERYVHDRTLLHLKGSIAGTYSLAGGGGILLL